jgi:hypothetical protein
MAKGEGSIIHENYNTVPIPKYRPHNLADFGIREFSDNDDWIMMVPVQKK